ncbi:hypothetical protein [Pantoea sp. B65]|uniref:hypothetical protein n=1 Tax=Pantoea sp. B65 TaxID=2813359 RepID=UPI0039B641E2
MPLRLIWGMISAFWKSSLAAIRRWRISTALPLNPDTRQIIQGARRLAQGIVRSIFVEDRELHYASLVAFDTPEREGDEWQDANDQ